MCLSLHGTHKGSPLGPGTNLGRIESLFHEPLPLLRQIPNSIGESPELVGCFRIRFPIQSTGHLDRHAGNAEEEQPSPPGLKSSIERQPQAESFLVNPSGGFEILASHHHVIQCRKTGRIVWGVGSQDNDRDTPCRPRIQSDGVRVGGTPRKPETPKTLTLPPGTHEFHCGIRKLEATSANFEA